MFSSQQRSRVEGGGGAKGAKKVICAAMPACTFDTFAPHGQMVMAYGIMKEPDSRGQTKIKRKEKLAR